MNTSTGDPPRPGMPPGRGPMKDGIQRWAMAGKRIPLMQTVRNGLQMYVKHHYHTGREIDVNVKRSEELAGLLRRFTGMQVRGAHVLEVGCGQRAALSLLLAASGAEVCALDVEAPTYRMNPAILRQLLQTCGIHRTAKSAIRHMLFDRRFFNGLARATGMTLRPFPHIGIRVCDIAHAELPARYFDLVCSYDVLGHVVDVESAVKNINAALAPDGVGYVVVHLFPSLTGADCLEWVFALDPAYGARVPARVPPWDHLRDNRYPGDSHLNRLRLKDYQGIFHRHTTVIAEDHQKEGNDLLSLAPRELLDEYTEEDLTTAYVAFTIRRRSRGLFS